MKALLLPSLHLMLAYRLSHMLFGSRLTRPFSYVVYLISRIFYASNIHPAARIGKGSHFVHHFNIVIGSTAVIGDNCTIFNGVTLGDNGKDRNLCPTIGDNVLLSAGSKVVGPVSVGSNSIVGANSVVIRDVPENSLAVGLPAVVKRTINREDYY